jgi:hypothetical protein
MSLIRIAALIRFFPKAHLFGSPIYVTASQHVPFASTAFGIQRAEFRDRLTKHGFRTLQNKLEPAKNPPASLLRRDRRASVEALWETAKAETTPRNVQGAGKRLNASRWQRKRRRGNNVLATSASLLPIYVTASQHASLRLARCPHSLTASLAALASVVIGELFARKTFAL